MSKKALFIVLGVLACLYFAALGTGIAVNDSGGGKSDNPSDMADRWVGKLKGLLPSGASALTQADQCNGQAMIGRFRLAKQRPSCAIGIGLPRGEDSASVSLKLVEVNGSPATVGAYIKATFDEQQFPDIRSDKSCSPKTPPVNSLVVTYAPNKGSSGDYECYIKKDPGEAVDITVTDGGGNLTLACERCKATLTIEGE